MRKSVSGGLWGLVAGLVLGCVGVYISPLLLWLFVWGDTDWPAWWKAVPIVMFIALLIGSILVGATIGRLREKMQQHDRL